MYDELTKAIELEQKRIQRQQLWVENFGQLMLEIKMLVPWKDDYLVNKVPTGVSKYSVVAGVDGGLISEAMTGFDLVLYRAVSSVFRGIGDRIQADYVPSFSPPVQIFFSPSLASRTEFSRIATLMRLYAEYDVAKLAIQEKNPSVMFIDGKVTPLSSDFTITPTNPVLLQAENDVKRAYNELVQFALEKKVLLCGVVKDSRSREMTRAIGYLIQDLIRQDIIDVSLVSGWADALDGMQDTIFGRTILSKGERTAWLETRIPDWVDGYQNLSVWNCLVRPVEGDDPTRLEIIVPANPSSDTIKLADLALSVMMALCDHGLPLAIPTVILEADERTKLSADDLNEVTDQIALSLGIPVEHLRKRRYFTGGLSRL